MPVSPAECCSTAVGGCRTNSQDLGNILGALYIAMLFLGKPCVHAAHYLISAHSTGQVIYQ